MTARDGTVQSARYGVGPYHQCWYPVAQSSELHSGAVVGRDVLDGRIVLYRTSDGRAQALSAYCKHLGADLSLGDLVGENVRCPFHHWQYDASGVCREIATGDRIPESARVFAFPTVERWDLIWIFNGPEPLYDVPSFGQWDDERMRYRTFEARLDQKLFCDPWFFGSNAFDFQHLRSLHNLEFEAESLWEQAHCMGYHSEDDTPGAGHWSMDVTLWGTNTVVVKADNDGSPAHHIAAGTPMGADGTRYFFVAATEIEPDNPDAEAQAEAVLDVVERVHTQVVNEDVPILNSIAPDRRLLVKSDRSLAQYFRYADRYPRASFADLQSGGPSK